MLSFTFRVADDSNKRQTLFFFYFTLHLKGNKMKSVKANVFATPIRVRVNTSNKNKHQWGQIVDAKSGAVLHTGQLKHIKYVAKKKYNTVASF